MPFLKESGGRREAVLIYIFEVFRSFSYDFIMKLSYTPLMKPRISIRINLLFLSKLRVHEPKVNKCLLCYFDIPVAVNINLSVDS